MIFHEIKWSKTLFFQNLFALEQFGQRMPLFRILLGVVGIFISSNFMNMLFGNMKIENEA